MKIHLSSTGISSLTSEIVGLGSIFPLINGDPHTAPPTQTRQANGRWIFEYALDPRSSELFRIEVEQISAISFSLWYSVIGLAEEKALNRFGIGFTQLENLRQYLVHGYHSWDGSFYVDPEALAGWKDTEPRPETGYAMTQLLPRSGSGSVVLGFDRHDHFQHTFTFDTHRVPCQLMIETLWDQKDRQGLPGCTSERLLIFEHPEVEPALREWAHIVAQKSMPPPRQTSPLSGWCSWYNLYNYITEENLLEHLAGVSAMNQREALPLKIFQIDDGFTPEMGDWLEVKPQFPRGMKPLLEDIRRSGFIPGLWIAPFLVGNRSHLYRDHPDWVLRERHTGAPLAHMKLYSEFRWGKRSEEYYILDTSHPAAFQYLRQVFRTWRQEWGCAYFKTDFMYFGCAYGPDRVVWHTPGSTRIEIWRRACEMIREEIREALWTGCGCPLWPAVGLVDCMRIGRDVGVEWRGNQSAQSLLRDQATRSFANQILWQVDPDCILLREGFHNLSESEVRSLALYAGMSGGLIMTSDALDELSPERLILWKLLLNPQRDPCKYPLLGQSAVVSTSINGKTPHELHALDTVSVQVRQAQSGQSAVFIFNTGDAPLQRSYYLASLGLPEDLYVFNWNTGTSMPGQANTLHANLPPHDGVLFFVQAIPFFRAPDFLP